MRGFFYRRNAVNGHRAAESSSYSLASLAVGAWLCATGCSEESIDHGDWPTTCERPLVSAGPSVVQRLTLPVNMKPGPITYDAATGVLYVADETTASIGAFDRSFALLGSFATPALPNALSELAVDVSAGSSRLFVADNNGAVHVHALPSGGLVCSLTVGAVPHLAFYAEKQKLYIGDEASHNVAVFDTSVAGCPTLRSTVSGLGDKPVALTVNPRDDRIFVAIHHENQVALIDGSADTLLSPKVPVLAGNPTSIAADPVSGRVFVGQNLGNRISSLQAGNPAGLDYTETLLEIGDAPVRVVTDPGIDRTYALSLNFNLIGVVTGTRVDAPIATTVLGMRPGALAVDAANHCLFVGSHPENPEGQLLLACEPASRELSRITLHQLIDQCVDGAQDPEAAAELHLATDRVECAPSPRARAERLLDFQARVEASAETRCSPWLESLATEFAKATSSPDG